jgi:putative peptidoglycan binding protein
MDDTDLEPTRSVPAVRAGANGGEDWLAEVGDVDWDDVGAPPGERGARRAGGGAAFGQAPGGERESIIHRRRLIAAVVAVVVVGLAILIPVIAFGGGGGTSEPPPVTTTTPATNPPPPPPANTTPTTTTTTKPAANVPKLELAQGQNLQAGSSGAQVKQLQNALKALGHDPGTVDGVYGPQTKAAVAEFQTAQKITADGVVGSETAAKLNQALEAQSSAG